MKVKEKAESFCANYGVMLTPRRKGMQVGYLLSLIRLNNNALVGFQDDRIKHVGAL